MKLRVGSGKRVKSKVKGIVRVKTAKNSLFLSGITNAISSSDLSAYANSGSCLNTTTT